MKREREREKKKHDKRRFIIFEVRLKGEGFLFLLPRKMEKLFIVCGWKQSITLIYFWFCYRGIK